MDKIIKDWVFQRAKQNLFCSDEVYDYINTTISHFGWEDDSEQALVLKYLAVLVECQIQTN
jgi:hypothetical protein